MSRYVQYPQGDVKIIQSQFLPHDETVSLCSIQDKYEFVMCTGKKINALRIGNELHVSPEIFQRIKTIYPTLEK